MRLALFSIVLTLFATTAIVTNRGEFPQVLNVTGEIWHQC
jgi:hypothetical protein